MVFALQRNNLVILHALFHTRAVSYDVTVTSALDPPLLDVICHSGFLKSDLGPAEENMPHATQLYKDFPATCWPIVYSSDYNITFIGLEKLHPFDSGKWGKVINFLREEKLITNDTIVTAREATEEDLLVVHTRRYLNKLKWSFVVATITEIPPLVVLPNFLVQRRVLKPLRTQTGGTIMAGKLAIERGWAINVGKYNILII
ncbi:hypothetical protein AB205_0176630 [Aquarana catesbeiana]|uniref:Histone deacetylase domain-containing protein n=1 Tax=Aquarana catesbeiana TaxID=8400 RepID=A0A2G9SHX2_AQUCT|nr:hypothetical protein AB205_0176630 [Aquarana catesbeiana]